MVLGIDDENGPDSLNVIQLAIFHFFGHKATSGGLKGQKAINFLEKKMKNNPELSYDETVLQFLLCNLFYKKISRPMRLRVENGGFGVLTMEEIEEHLTAISERD